MLEKNLIFAWLFWNPPESLLQVRGFQLEFSWVFFALGVVASYSLGLVAARFFYALKPKYDAQDVLDLQKVEKRVYKKFQLTPKDPIAFLNQQIFTKQFEFSNAKGFFFFIARSCFSSHRFQRLLNRCYLDRAFKSSLVNFKTSSRRIFSRLFFLYVSCLVLALFLTLLLKNFLGVFQYLEAMNTYIAITCNFPFEIAYSSLIIAAFLGSKFLKPFVKTEEKLWFFLDLSVVPFLVFLTFIYMGEFASQFGIGKPSHVPWAVIFGRPFDNSFPVPRHPSQLYEAVGVLGTLIGVFLGVFYGKKEYRQGLAFCFSGFFLFTVRFMAGFFKESLWAENSFSGIMVSQSFSVLLMIFFAVLTIKQMTRNYVFLHSMES